MKQIINKILRRAIRAIPVNHFSLIPAYDYVQNVSEHNIHRYIGCNSSDIRTWCIVGGYLANEIYNIRKTYSKAEIFVFECSDRYIKSLHRQWSGDGGITIVGKAVSNQCGKFKFFETSLNGSGSLLELGELHRKSYGSTAAEIFDVEAITLDVYFKNRQIDVLQIDVQGAEKLVLEGAGCLLREGGIKAIFLEISVKENLYKGATTFDELYQMLKQQGFELALVGTDFNLTGNALFVRSGV